MPISKSVTFGLIVSAVCSQFETRSFLWLAYRFEFLNLRYLNLNRVLVARIDFWKRYHCTVRTSQTMRVILGSVSSQRAEISNSVPSSESSHISDLSLQIQGRGFFLKRVPRPLCNLSLRIAIDFAKSQRLRLHVDCNQEELGITTYNIGITLRRSCQGYAGQHEKVRPQPSDSLEIVIYIFRS